jgi:hypothetical protein
MSLPKAPDLIFPTYITYSEWVPAALGIQHAMCMRSIILSSVACPAWFTRRTRYIFNESNTFVNKIIIMQIHYHETTIYSSCKMNGWTNCAIWTTLQAQYMPLPTEEISRNFNICWNFPNCIESIHSKHIRIYRLPKSGSQYFKYKQYHSLVMLLVVDAYIKFVPDGWTDRQNNT